MDQPIDRLSYRDALRGTDDMAYMEFDGSGEDDHVSDDDVTEEDVESPWFSMRMSRQENVDTRKP